jgi:enamine deaminase RidA (YjgF/YER057c/UK114 family)
MSKRQAIFPTSRHALYEKHGYSAAIQSGDLLFVSGQVGSREDGSVEPDFANQVRLAFKNLEATLEAAGCTLDGIVDVTTFHTDPENQFGVLSAPTQTGPQLASTGWLASTSRSRSSHVYQLRRKRHSVRLMLHAA